MRSISINKATDFTCELIVNTHGTMGGEGIAIILELPEVREMCAFLSIEETETLIAVLSVAKGAKQLGIDLSKHQLYTWYSHYIGIKHEVPVDFGTGMRIIAHCSHNDSMLPSYGIGDVMGVPNDKIKEWSPAATNIKG